MFTPLKRAMTAFLLVGLVAGAVAGYVGAFDFPTAPPASADTSYLSPYWRYAVRRWEDLIVQEANRRELDPDFVASLVWQESRGDPDAVGPKGAVGLVQVMPKEAGFSWRPSQEALLNPSVNLFWGTRTLATVIEQGNGDIFHALAAYNGGWDQIRYSRPRRFATTIMRDYARAVAQRYDVQGRWIAFFALRDVRINGPIWVADSSRSDVYLYGYRNIVPEGTPLIPPVPPVSIVADCESDAGETYSVGIWLYSVTYATWNVSDAHAAATPVALRTTPTPVPLSTVTPVPDVPTATPTSAPSATVAPPSRPAVTVSPTLRSASPTPTPTWPPSPTPTPTPDVSTSTESDARVLDDGAELRPGPTLWWDPTDMLQPGSLVDVLGYDSRLPDWVYVSTLDGDLEGWTQVESLELYIVLKQLPLVTPRPTLTPTTTATVTPTPTPTIACTGESLWAEAWAMKAYRGVGQSWTAQIYARGHGGNCMYAYSWNGSDDKGMSTDGIFFEITVDRREPILGTVVVTSGDETVSVGVYVPPP